MTRNIRWTDNEDLIVTETVLKGVRNGKTLSHAFNEASEKLKKRTPGAIAFRWKNELLEKYEQAYQIAKAQSLNSKSNDSTNEELVEKQFKNMMDKLTNSEEQEQPVNTQQVQIVEEPRFGFEEDTITVNKEINHEDIISFLNSQQRENVELKAKVARLEQQLEASKKELEETQARHEMQNEDYNTLIQIIERAKDLANK